MNIQNNAANSFLNSPTTYTDAHAARIKYVRKCIEENHEKSRFKGDLVRWDELCVPCPTCKTRLSSRHQCKNSCGSVYCCDSFYSPTFTKDGHTLNVRKGHNSTCGIQFPAANYNPYGNKNAKVVIHTSILTTIMNRCSIM